MASIRRRGAKWQVQIRPQGHPPVSKTFHKKADAERWTIKTEAAIQRGDPVGEHRDLKQTTMGDLQKRYRETVSPSKRGSDVERLRVRAGINDLHFHDLRHEAISRLFELGLTVPEVASISGHRDVRMRYAHICSTEGIAIKLSAVTSQ